MKKIKFKFITTILNIVSLYPTNTIGHTIPKQYTRFTRVDWYEYWFPTVGIIWYELDSTVARECSNKTLIYSAKQGWSGFKQYLHTILYDCLTVQSTV